jgi:subtilisin family serine protease
MLPIPKPACVPVLLALLLGLTTSRRVEAQVTRSFVPGLVLVGFHADVSNNRAQAILTAAGARSVGQIAPIHVHRVQLPPGANEAAAARAFARRPEVAFAELDRILPPAMTPNDADYPSEWHLSKIGAPTAWNSTTGSSSVVMAIIDTGVDGTHPDLAPKMVPGWNFYDNNSDTDDVYGHGTAVAGTAAACSDNGIGVASVAWGCQIMPIRVTDTQGNATYSAIASGITYAADHGARVANASFDAAESATITAAAQYLQSTGGILTVAAGNDGTVASSPDNPYLLTVSATDATDALASWSNTGSNVDLSAPGVQIETTVRGGGYGWGSGTSFAAPIVAGVAALVISVNPGLTASQVRSILEQSADDLGPAGWDPSYGWGRVNAARAVSMAAGTVNATGGTPDSTPPTVTLTAPAAGATVSRTASVSITATDNVGVVRVELYLDGQRVATVRATPFTTWWRTHWYVFGAHTLQCRAYDAAGNVGVSAPVTVYR